MKYLLKSMVIGVLLILNASVMGQGAVFADGTILRQTIRASDGSYYVRSTYNFGSKISKLSPEHAHIWTKEFTDIYNSPVYSIQPNNSGGFIIVAPAAPSVSMPEGDPVEHYIRVVNIDPEGNVIYAKRHGVWIDIWENGFLEPFSYFERPLSMDEQGNVFVLLHIPSTNFPISLMKQNSDGTLAWCRQLSENAMFLSAPVPSNDGGCFTVHQQSFDTVILTRYAADGTIVWSKQVQRAGYLYTGSFNVHLNPNGDITVFGTSGKNLVKMVFSSNGALQEHTLVAPIPTLPLGIQPNLIGSAMGDNGNLVAFTSDHATFRITRFDPSGALFDVHSAPPVDSAGWVVKYFAEDVHDHSEGFTLRGNRNTYDPIFGYYSDDPFILTSSFDLVSFCFLSSAQYAVTDVPLVELNVSDVAPLPLLPVGLTTDYDVTSSDVTDISASEFCTVATGHNSLDIEENIYIYPNPAIKGQACIIGSSTDGTILISDTQGRTIYRDRSRMNYVLETQDLAPGLYVIRLTNELGSLTHMCTLVVQ